MKTGTATVAVASLLALLAFVGCDENDGDLKAVDPDGGPDLALTKTVDLAGNRTPHEGAVIRYLVDVANTGTWDASEVTVRDSLPAQVTLVAADAEQGAYDPETHLWTVGTLPADSAVTLVLTVSVNEQTLGQVVANTARIVTATPADDDDSDNRYVALFAVLNDPPLAGDDAYTCDEGDTLEVAAPGILDNDGDVEGEPFELDTDPVSAPWHGALTLRADGGFTYIHDGSEAPVDSFTYEISDAGTASDQGTVRLTITPVNDPPVAVADLFQVAEQGTVTGNVLGNDEDPDQDVLSAVLDTGPGHAAHFEFSADGQFTYTHDGSEILRDEFSYHADDGHAQSDPVIVTIAVSATNDPPVVADIPDQSVDEGASFALVALDAYVTDPDHDDEELEWSHAGAMELVVAIDPDTRHCTVAAPDPDWHGSEIITFRATDPYGMFDEDQAIFTVSPVNDPPYIQPIPAQTVAEGGDFAALYLDMFVHDPDDPDAELEWVASETEPLVVIIDGQRRLHASPPDPDWSGQVVVHVTVEDPGGLADHRDIAFTVTPVNDTPVTSPLPDQTIEAGGTFLPITLDLYVDDVDNDDAEMTWTYRDNVPLMVTLSDERVIRVYPPDPQWTGEVTIIFRATDPSGAWDETEATFRVVEGLPAAR